MKNLLFVDDDPNVLQGLQRQLRAMRSEWNMNFVGGGQRALDFMKSNPVDVIISDMTMPGMNGAQLLNTITKRHPNTVRIVLSGHAEQDAILSLVGPAHQYLSKPCDAEELRKAIARAIAMRDLLGSERLKQLATRIKCLPSLPALHEQLTRELRNDGASLEHVGEIIAHDIGMTTKILQLVNSAFFGLPQPINHPTDAVMYLGLNTVRSLVLTLQIFSQYDQENCKGFSLGGLAHHCWVTGISARRIAREERKDAKMLEECFLAGLLHDVGQLILATGLPGDYQEVLNLARSSDRPITEVEQERFGASHAEVGAYLLGLWGLPNLIIEVVALHHRPHHCITDEFSPIVAVHVADVFMHERSGNDSELPPPRMNMEFLARLGLQDRVETWRKLCMNDAEE